MDMEFPEDLGSTSQYLEVPGFHHCVVTGVFESQMPPKQNGEHGKSIEGFSATFELCSGPEKGKTFSLTFFNGKLSSKDGGRSALLKQTAFCFATDLIGPEDFGKKKTIDFQEAVGSQVCVDVEKTEDGKFWQLRWFNIHHVDDPMAASVEKDKELIDSIPKNLRHGKDHFEKVRKAFKREPAKQQQQIKDEDFAGI